MKIMKTIFAPFRRDTEFIKTLNYIATSDYDQSYLKKEKVKTINFFKWVYLIFVLCALAMAFVPLVARSIITTQNTLFLNITMFCIFSLDYFFRWITYSYRASKKSKYPFFFFPFTGVSLIMLFGIFPSFIALFLPLIEQYFKDEAFNEIVGVLSSLVILQLGRLILLLNVVAPFRIFTRIFEKQRKILFYVFFFLILVTLLFAVIIYNAEDGKVVDGNVSKINNYWDAFYFTVISICTIGYGDIVPVTDMGKSMVIILAFVGVGIFTIPGAVIGAGFLDELQDAKDKIREQERKNAEEGVKKQDDERLSLMEKTIAKSLDQVKKVVNVNNKTFSKVDSSKVTAKKAIRKKSDTTKKSKKTESKKTEK